MPSQLEHRDRPGEPGVPPTAGEPPSPDELRARAAELTAADRRRVERRLDALRHGRAGRPGRRGRPGAGRSGGGAAADPAELLAGATEELERGEARIVRRRTSVPVISYPEQLPVSGRRQEILEAIRDHQVVIVSGETGSGKTTQLPKICLELGRGVRGMIGHTQPRRIAARSVAERIADELGTELGGAVGYQVRFGGSVGDDTLVKLMTDGIALAEVQRDRLLEAYDTIIIDEAHERSLNIDFLLGYLHQLLPRRPDLKLVITSATIDAQRFSEHFGGAPVIEVSGRTFPVEVRYRPLVEDADDDGDEDDGEDAAPAGRRRPPRDPVQAICEAVDELAAAGPGDVLVFLSGEREIRDTADALAARDLRSTEVLPLYARLSSAEQHRVFSAHPGRRIVLATNVAETSLTVPGIRYVIDPGTARISRYSSRLKVQRLPIEAVSQASANQRAGRCGRVADGICIRLYSEEDFAARPEFTDPEILRTNLASVLLQMASLGLGEIADFPFVDPPDRRAVRDGVQLLQELGALDPDQPDARQRLTPLGRKLAQLPVDPRLARMVLEADRNGCVREVVVIAAALSIQDPRERPVEKRQAADELHRRFADETSDFVAYLNLWRYLKEQQAELSSSAFRRLCKAEFLHYLRVREWQDLESQLRSVARSLEVPMSTSDDPRALHRSLLAGLLSHVGLKDPEKGDYLGARGARFAVFPGSALAKKQPRFAMAAELVETSRLWARVVARIEPEDAEALAGHLVKRSYSEPHWEHKRGSVVAFERVTLYGVPLAAGRKVQYGRIDPELSRELFVRHALVEGDWTTHHRFAEHNRRVLEEVGELEHRARRRDLVVGEEALFDFYDARLPAGVVSQRHFDRWWKEERRSRPDLLDLTPGDLLRTGEGVDQRDFPLAWRQGGLDLDLSYRFEPGAPDDGVTAHVPLAVLNQVSPDGFDWQVPGLRHELVTALLRTLSKQVRTAFVPAPDVAATVLRSMAPADGPLLDVLARQLQRYRGAAVPAEAWQLDRLPEHLRMRFSVEGEDGAVLAVGSDLDALKAQLAPTVRQVLSRALAGTVDALERGGATSWEFGTLPQRVERSRAGLELTGFPALVDEGGTVGVRVFETEAEQRRAMWRGTRRLLLLTVPSPVRGVQAGLGNAAKLALARSPGGLAALLEDCLAACVDTLLAQAGGPVWDEEAYGRLRDAVRGDLAGEFARAVDTARQVLAEAQDVERRLSATSSLPLVPALRDMRAQLAALVHPGFVSAAGARRLPDLLRYVRGIGRRLDKLAENPQRDRDRMLAVATLQEEYEAARARTPRAPLGGVRWMLEELRVSYFAQGLGTAYPVSDKQVRRALQTA